MTSCPWAHCCVSRLQRRRSSWPGSMIWKWMIKLLPRLDPLSSAGQGVARKCTYLGPSTTGVNFHSHEGNCLGGFMYCLSSVILLFLNDLRQWIERGVFIIRMLNGRIILLKNSSVPFSHPHDEHCFHFTYSAVRLLGQDSRKEKSIPSAIEKAPDLRPHWLG